MGAKIVYERFLWFEGKVRSGRFPNASQLAREFEISPKTAQRDIEFMRDRLNCPLIYDTTRKGYYYEKNISYLPGYTKLSSSELSSLMIARKLLGAMSGGLIAGEVNAAIGKITSILEQHTTMPDALENLLSFRLIEYSPVREDTFRTVLEACARKEALIFKYRSPAREETTERTVDPYHLFNYMGNWHMVGYCHLREGIRDFKLSRTSGPRLTGRNFTIPADFTPERYFQSSFGLYKAAKTRTVTLRFTPETARWIDDLVWHRDQKKKSLDDGSLELSLPVADLSEIRREILKFGSGVEVLEPEDLRRSIISEAENILKQY
jgi:predicted DNA-binding transcriptional regulator YafY